MRFSSAAVSFVLIASPLLTVSSVGTAHPFRSSNGTDPLHAIAEYHGAPAREPARDDKKLGGIDEDILRKYAARYSQWKAEFLSTEAGRNQWALYEANPHFTLTITVARENAEGATTGNYKWNSAGQLSAATITLGVRLDAGYPNPIYFPVMNSLVPTETSHRVDGNTLAATKLAHEFGHVNRTAKVDASIYQLQAQLIPKYNEIFLTNGRNQNDPRLLELARQIGGTPVEIWEDREYWGEANAMLYLSDRFTDESLRCTLFNKIRQSVDLYAKNYEKRFLEVAQSTPAKSICGWQ